MKMTKIIEEITHIKRNHLITTLDQIDEEYQIIIEFVLDGVKEGFPNIVHFTTGGNSASYGDRIPAIYYDKRYNELVIVSAINDHANYMVKAPDICLGVLHRVEILQEKIGNEHVYVVMVNHQLINCVVNHKPTKFYNVNVFASDPWFDSQSGYIKELSFITNFKCTEEDKPSGALMDSVDLDKFGVKNSTLERNKSTPHHRRFFSDFWNYVKSIGRDKKIRDEENEQKDALPLPMESSTHMEVKSNNFVCFYCPMKFPEMREMDMHLAKNHPAHNKHSAYQNNFCYNDLFTSYEYLRRYPEDRSIEKHLSAGRKNAPRVPVNHVNTETNQELTGLVKECTDLEKTNALMDLDIVTIPDSESELESYSESELEMT